MTSWTGTAAAERTPAGDRDSGVSFATVLAAAGTRIAALAVVLLVLASTDSIVDTVAVAAALAIPYAVARVLLTTWIVRTGARQLATVADLVCTGMLVGIASDFRHGIALVIVLAAIAGGLRGVADAAHELTDAGAAVSSILADTKLSLVIPLCGGIAAGAVVGWLGVVSVVWLAAIAFAASAALTAWTVSPVRAGSGDAAANSAIVLALDHDTQELGVYRPYSARRVGLRSAVIGASIQNAGQAGALAIVLLWVHGVLQSPSALGLVGGAFVAGAFAGCVASYGAQRALEIGVAAALGFAIGAAPLSIGAHLPALSAVIACAAFVAGAVFATRPPRDEVIVDYAGVPQEPVLAENLSAALAFGLLPIAAGVGAAITKLSPVGGLLAGGVLYLIAVGVPILRRDASGPEVSEPEVAVAVAERFAGVATWVAVTLIYAEGGWTVEVERKEGVSEGGHEVKSTDALRAIDILDLPGLREEIEQAIVDDQTRAEQETQRLRDELGGVDERLAAIKEMVEWSELWRANR